MKRVCISIVVLLLLVVPVRAEEGLAGEGTGKWKAHDGDGFHLVIPSGWRELPFLSPTRKLYLNGDGIEAPAVDETGSPVQIGLMVESFPNTKEPLEAMSRTLAESATGDPRLQAIGEHTISPVTLSDGTEAHLLVMEFIKEQRRKSLQMKLIAKDKQSTAWIVTGFLVGGKESRLPTRNSALAERLRAHISSLCFDATKIDLSPFPSVYGMTEPKKRGQEEHSAEWSSLTKEVLSLWERDQLDRAIVVAQKALAVAERGGGPHHPDVAMSLDLLAGIYADQGKYAQAAPLLKRAGAINRKAFGADHIIVAFNMTDLADVYYEQGKHAQAKSLYRRALTIFEKTSGPDHPAVARFLSELAKVHVAQRQFEQAEQLYERALAIREKAGGSDDPDVAESLINLADLYHAQDKDAQAEPLYKRALAIREKAGGPDDPDVAASLESLAAFYRATERNEEADPLEKRAERIRAIEADELAKEWRPPADLDFVDLSAGRVPGFKSAVDEARASVEELKGLIKENPDSGIQVLMFLAEKNVPRYVWAELDQPMLDIIEYPFRLTEVHPKWKVLVIGQQFSQDLSLIYDWRATVHGEQRGNYTKSVLEEMNSYYP